MHTQALKSKDIDMIVDYDQLEKFKKEFEVSKNERLKKYEIKIEEIDVDIYLPYFSDLGLPVEEIKNYFQSVEGFSVPIPEILLILKVYTLRERRGTAKGKKDLTDIFSLISQKKIDWQKYGELVRRYKIDDINRELKDIISGQGVIPELDLLNHQIARLKKETLEKIARFVV